MTNRDCSSSFWLILLMLRLARSHCWYTNFYFSHIWEYILVESSCKQIGRSLKTIESPKKYFLKNLSVPRLTDHLAKTHLTFLWEFMIMSSSWIWSSKEQDNKKQTINNHVHPVYLHHILPSSCPCHHVLIHLVLLHLVLLNPVHLFYRCCSLRYLSVVLCFHVSLEEIKGASQFAKVSTRREMY